MLLAADHKGTEAALKASGLTYTLLRNGWYIENHTGSLGGAIAAGALIGSAGEGRFSAAARKDFAEAIAVTASTSGHDNAVYELAGDHSYSYADLAAEVSRQTGKTIRPLAVAANPERFTDPAKVEKWFGRNCKEVVGRACTPGEKANFVAYMSAVR